MIRNLKVHVQHQGYIKVVLRILNFSEGKILLFGDKSFKVSYEDITLKPENGEVIDAPIV